MRSFLHRTVQEHSGLVPHEIVNVALQIRAEKLK